MYKLLVAISIVLLVSMLNTIKPIVIATIHCKQPFPSYYVSHGSPNLVNKDDEMTDKGAYEALERVGAEIRGFEPDFIIANSAHFQSSEPGTIEISINRQDSQNTNQLIYDFYGFGKDLYEQKFESHSSVLVGVLIARELEKHGFKAKIVDRGIDHGVWVPLKVAFGSKLEIPLIAVSLPYSDSFDESYKLGKVLKEFRTKLIWDPERETDIKGLVICSGMSVHNLRDIWRSVSYSGGVMPYVEEFHDVLESIVKKSTSLSLLQNLNNLKKDANYKQILCQAHPSLEHFLPFIVAAGTIDGSSDIKQFYVSEMMSLGWAMYKFYGGGKLQPYGKSLPTNIVEQSEQIIIQ